MKWISVTLVVGLGFAGVAFAQDSQAAPSTEIVQTPPAGYPPPAQRLSYDEHRRAELERGIKRTRNALIATSASLVVGMALTIPAFTSNNCVENSFNNDYSCTTAGKALVGVGAPFLAVGFWGVIVSGIMFGVRRGKLRRLNERVAYEGRAKLRWDPYQSKFVF
ncbi:MAG: hypothetical protein WBG86_04440 [Polyangiales bacterium]